MTDSIVDCAVCGVEIHLNVMWLAAWRQGLLDLRPNILLSRLVPLEEG